MEEASLPRTRIAPTPSGYLHAGNAVNFLLTRRMADHLGARLLLRIDDLDAERARPAFLQDVFECLAWLGIQWDEGPSDAHDHVANWSQTRRLDRYQALADALRTGGHLYACTCSRRSIRQHAAPGDACPCKGRDLPFDTPDTAWRLLVPKGTIVRVPRLFGGEEEVDLALAMGDAVLRQRDGRPAYQLASLADDVDRGITIIVRGVDLLSSTACQRHIAELLGLEAFLRVRFAHHPLLLDEAGEKLSKSAGASALRSMREAGTGPEHLIAKADALFKALAAGAF